MIIGSPFESYSLHWRLFRCMSDENITLSNAILNCDLYKNFKYTKVIDIGTGDGDIAFRLIDATKNKEFILVDPSKEYLQMAEALTSDYKSRVSYWQDTLRNIKNKIHVNSLCLSIHMIYLLSEEEIETLLNLPYEGVNLIIILDSRDSIFTHLWEICANSYSSKCKYFYDILKRKYRKPKMTHIETKVLSPFINTLDDFTRKAMLSIMCYADWDKLLSNNQDKVEKLIKAQNSNVITCKSNLIEIPVNTL